MRLNRSGAVKKSVAVGGGALAAALMIAAPLVQHFEGRKLKPYRDVVQVLTVCDGHTGNDIENRTYTPAQCDTLLKNDLAVHARVVLHCAPSLIDHPNQLAAFTSFDYNTGAFCRSTARKLVTGGNIPSACAELDKWVYAKGKKLPGLITRRAEERRLCEQGISASNLK